jgi:hypothetical protein
MLPTNHASALHPMHPYMMRRKRVGVGRHGFPVPNLDSLELEADILMPFAAGLNPAIDCAETQNYEWLSSLGFADIGDDTFRGVSKAAFHHLGALVYREEDSIGLSLATNFITFLFLFDDMVDSAESAIGTNVERTRQVTQMLMRGVDGRWASPGEADHLEIGVRSRRKVEGLQNALADITWRMKQLRRSDGSEPDLRHYRAAMSEYLEGNVREAEGRDDRSTQDVRSYTDLRLAVSAVHPCLEVGCITRRLHVDTAIRSRRAFAKMRRACNLNVSYINDLFSYKKEALAGETSNLVIVLSTSMTNSTVQQALDQACKVVDETILDYLEAADEFMDSAEPGIRGYMCLMESWMRGNLEWYLAHNERYLDASSTDLPIVRLDAPAVAI